MHSDDACRHPQSTGAEIYRSLDKAEVGQLVRLKAVNASSRTRERLLSMGLPPGAVFEVLRNRGGSVVIGRQSNRLAIGREMAKDLLIQPTIDPGSAPRKPGYPT